MFGWGNAGYVCKVTKDIALKRSMPGQEERVDHEHKVFDLLERHPCPDMVRSFIRLPGLNFMQLVPGGTLEARLRTHQVRDVEDMVTAIMAREPYHLVLRWMTQLSNAAAWLKSLALVHGDIRPANLLLDPDDHVKLSDLDNAARVGEDVDAGGYPYMRLLGAEAGPRRGTFGVYGPCTEQFAIGSVFYYLVRGFEPYDDVWLGEEHGCAVVDMLQKMKFPALDESEGDDTIIAKCWHHGSDSIKDLAVAIRSSSHSEVVVAETMPADVFRARQEECREMLSGGLLGLNSRLA